MPDVMNRIRNPRFIHGVKRPRCWTWKSDSEAIDWVRTTEAEDADTHLIITSREEGGRGVWIQRLRCAANRWYRIEAVVTSRCRGAHEHAGVGLWVIPLTKTDAVGPVRLAGALSTRGPLTLRSFYKTPPHTRSLEVHVGLCNALGSVAIHSVLLIPNMEPDARSHPLALPPPPYAYPAPRQVRRICLCDDTGEERPLVAMLRKRYGQRAIRHVKRTALSARTIHADALLIAGSRPPSWMGTLSALEKTASKHLIIVSLEAFAKIVGNGLTVRTIEQPDDPIHAKIRWANFISRGFALQDVFPLASTTADARVYRQRHLRRGAVLNTLRKEHGFEPMMLSVTDSSATSDHPICLYKPIEGGGVIVFDTDAVETPPTTCDEPNLAAFCLLNMLGTEQVSLGQYTVGAETEHDWYQLLKEFSLRFEPLRLSGRDRHDHILEFGADEQTLGLPSRSRPLLLVRTGLGGDDPSGIYGVLLFLKQLVRPEPYRNPYVRDLIDEFRIAWVPLSAPWQGSHWDAGLASERVEVTGDFAQGSVAAVIDITNSPWRRLRIVYGRDDPDFIRQSRLLPTLASNVTARRYFYRTGSAGSRITEREKLTWKMENLIPAVVHDPSKFETDFHRRAASAGARLIRIEVPGSNTNFVCNSIWRTDLVATTLEHVIGLQYGMIVMNRYGSSIAFAGHPPLKPGQAIKIHGDKTGGLASMLAG